MAEVHGCERRLAEIVQWPADAGRADQNIHRPSERNARAIDGHRQLLGIGHVGADPERISPMLFDFEARQVQFRFAPPNQRNSRSEAGEPKGEPLPDAASRPGHKDALVS